MLVTFDYVKKLFGMKMTESTNGIGGCSGTSNGESSGEFEEIKIPVPWGHISGKWWGSKTQQPIIAIHGWQDNAGTFDNLAPLLTERGLSLLCIDLPGHGFSSHLPPGQYYYIFWDGIHILRRIVKHYNWAKITVIGHSLGGAIAFLYAASFPDDIEKYISLDIASPSVRKLSKMVNVTGGSIDKFLKYESLRPDQMPCYDYNEMLKIVVDAYAGSVTEDSCKIMMKRGMLPVGNGEKYVFTRDPRLKVAALGFMTIDQVLEFASRIKCEVMNIRGDPGMTFDNPEYYDMVLDAIEAKAKKLERHIVKGTHHLHLNDAESIAGIISEFLIGENQNSIIY